MAQRGEVDTRGGPLRLRLSNFTFNSLPFLVSSCCPLSPIPLSSLPFFHLFILTLAQKPSFAPSHLLRLTPLLATLLTTLVLFAAASPFPPRLPSSSPFIALILAFLRSYFLDADESRNLSALRTCTTDLCVGQRFKDESLSTQRLCTHAFALENTELGTYIFIYIYIFLPTSYLFLSCGADRKSQYKTQA